MVGANAFRPYELAIRADSQNFRNGCRIVMVQVVVGKNYRVGIERCGLYWRGRHSVMLEFCEIVAQIRIDSNSHSLALQKKTGLRQPSKLHFVAFICLVCRAIPFCMRYARGAFFKTSACRWTILYPIRMYPPKLLESRRAIFGKSNPRLAILFQAREHLERLCIRS